MMFTDVNCVVLHKTIEIKGKKWKMCANIKTCFDTQIIIT